MNRDTMPCIVRQLLEAATDRQRAEILLQMPDHLLFLHENELRDVCRLARFSAADDFITVRLSVLGAVRGTDGHLPPPMADFFEEWRAAFAAFAAGGVQR